MKETTTPGQESVAPGTNPIYFPYDISFADSEVSPATTVKIEECLAKLARHYDRITDCTVIIRIPHKHGGARFFHVHIQLDIPGKRIAVSREPEANDQHTEIQTAIKDAFQKITRQLDDYVKLRNERKPH